MSYIKHVCVSTLFLMSITGQAWADESAEESFSILGKEVYVGHTLSITSDDTDDDISESGVDSSTNVTLFGEDVELLKNSVEYTVSEDDGLSFDNNFYVNGVKVLAESFVDDGGSYTYSLEIPNTNLSVEAFAYSLGIFTISVESGLTCDGDMTASVSSDLLEDDEIVLTDESNLVSASVDVDVEASAYIEGVAKILFIKGGVGGSVDLIDGNANASIAVTPANIEEPDSSFGGSVDLLNGNLYAYIGAGSSKWWTKDLYESDGSCFSFGDSSCQ